MLPVLTWTARRRGVATTTGTVLAHFGVARHPPSARHTITLSSPSSVSGTVVESKRLLATSTTPLAAPAEGKVVKKVVKKKKKVVAPQAGSTTTTATPSAPTPGSTSSATTPATPASAPVRPPAPAAPAPQGSTPPPATGKTAMVKSYRVEDVSGVCGPHDAIFARRLPTGGCQFFAWPGTPLDVAGRAIVSMPDTIRTVHTVFGRKDTPLDLVMDVDCPVPPEHWTMSKIAPFQQKLLDDTLGVVHEELRKAGLEVLSQVVLQSPNLKKASFHIHTKLKNAAFADYESVHGFLSAFKDRIPHVDLQIYRPHGMLRMFSCMKENHTSAMVVFESERWNIGFPNGKVPDADAALHSLCVREPGTYERLLTFKPPMSAQQHSSSLSPSSSSSSGANAGEEGERRFHVVEMPRTAQEAIDNASRWLRNTTEVEVGEWRSWIGIGICAFRVAYHFKDSPKLRRSPLEELQEAWVKGSSNCPSKFKPGDCEHKWNNFDPNKLTVGDWWSAYQRLGRLSFAVEEGKIREAEREKERAARLEERRRAPKPVVPPAPAAPVHHKVPSPAPAAPQPAASATGAAPVKRTVAKKKIRKTK